MLHIRTIVKICTAGSAGIGMTTIANDLANFLRSTADWVDAGGNVQLVLGFICVTFGLWAAADVWKVWRDRKAKTATENTPASKEAGGQPAVDSALRKTLEREAESKARSDQVDAEFRTIQYKLNTALGAIFGITPGNDGDEK